MSNTDNTKDKILNIQEVAVLINSSVPTISSWYRWKQENPDHEYAKMLPNFERHGAHRARYWKFADVWKLVEFKQALPQGRNGILGSITQKYVKSNYRNRNKDAE